MTITHPILADVSAGISELKKNPMAVVSQGDGTPVAILNRNEPVIYAVPAKAFDALMDMLEEHQLGQRHDHGCRQRWPAYAHAGTG